MIGRPRLGLSPPFMIGGWAAAASCEASRFDRLFFNLPAAVCVAAAISYWL